MSARRQQSASTLREGPETNLPRSGDTSFTRSEGLCLSILAQRSAGKLTGGQAGSLSSRSGKLGQPRGTGTEEKEQRTARSSPRITALAREAA